MCRKVSWKRRLQKEKPLRGLRSGSNISAEGLTTFGGDTEQINYCTPQMVRPAFTLLLSFMMVELLSYVSWISRWQAIGPECFALGISKL